MANIFPTFSFFILFPKQSQQQQQLKCFATIIMATKINNVMLEIQTINNIVLFLLAHALKNVITSSSNEKNKQ